MPHGKTRDLVGKDPTHGSQMYCSLDEAFQTGSVIPDFRQQRKKRRNGGSSNGSSGSSGSSGVGLIERFSTQTAEGLKPLLPPPESHVIEPDRPSNRPPPSDLVGGGVGNSATPTSYSNLLSATESSAAGSNFFLYPHADSPDMETAFLLEPDWTKPFQSATAPPWIQERMAKKEAEVPLTPTPESSTLFDGMPTLWQRIPSPAPTSAQSTPAPVEISEDRLMLLESKLDGKLERMFAKLEALEKGRSESNHMEVILFILGGLFLLLMLDLLVKQGTRASMMLAAAGGGLLHKRYMT